MFFRSARRSRATPAPAEGAGAALEQEAVHRVEQLRDHWANCVRCRGAAAASASLWCEFGIELMNRGVAEHEHWDSCEPCRAAQAQVDAARCEEGRELEREFKALMERLPKSH